MHILTVSTEEPTNNYRDKVRKKALRTYLIVLAGLISTTLAALYDGGYHIAGGIVAGVAFASVISSLIPYFIAMYFFEKFEETDSNKFNFKIFGWVFFIFCFPVKIWIILSNLNLLINGGERWAFC
jgi:hypothetical protein